MYVCTDIMSRATAPPRDLIRPCQRLLTSFSALHPRVGAYRPPRCSRPWRSPERSGFACAVKKNTSSHTTSLSSFDAFETTHRPLIRLFRAAYLSRIPRSLTRAHPQEGWETRRTTGPCAQHFKFSSSSHFMSCPLRNRWSKRSALTIDCFCVTAAD